MSDFRLCNFLDFEAVVHDDEDDNVEEDELLDDFFVDDIEESKETPSEGPVFPHLAGEASQLHAEASALPRVSGPQNWMSDDNIPEPFLHPMQYDPDLWAAGCKLNLVLQILRKCSTPDSEGIHLLGRKPPHSTAGSGWPSHCQTGHTTSRSPKPTHRTPSESQSLILSHRRGSMGFVCDWDPSSDLEIVVALFPQILHKKSRNWTRGSISSSRPSPHSWTPAQITAEWGPASVQVTSPTTFKFQNDVYESGLVMKRYALDSLVVVDVAPANLDAFMTASCIRERSSFIPWIHHFAQDTIKARQRVIVESGEQKGMVGYISKIVDAVATIVPASHVEDQTPLVLHVLLQNLAPHYLPGDNVKGRWCNSDGIIQSLNEEQKTLVYVERTTHKPVKASMDCVEFFDPPRWFYTLKPGTWVEFHKPGEFQHLTRRGYVNKLTYMHAFVVDAHTRNEIEIDMREVQIASIQAPSLPKKDGVHPLVSQRVKVTRGNLKGYRALVKDVSTSYVMIEIDAKLVGANTPYAHIQWTDFVAVPKELEPIRSSPPQRLATPPPLTELGPSRALTPEPKRPMSFPDSVMPEQETHWLLSEKMQAILERNRIPMHIRGIVGSGHGSMDKYEKNTAWTVVTAECMLNPRDGEVVVTIFKRFQLTQISINPSFLIPWDTVVGSEVVAIVKPFLGLTGVVVVSEGDSCTIRVKFLDGLRDVSFLSKNLANLEPVKK
ncbi:hypothetical protein EI94DRAFT_1700269 [Lactarius quietus]|nr:hypothetical protein EI94DRAFT_1700269 [Lactarius quietus]